MFRKMLINENVSGSDLGVQYGFSLFETFLVDNSGKVFLLDKHVERLLKSMIYFEFNYEINEKILKNNVIEYIQNNKLKNIIVRITLTYGNSHGEPVLLITTREKVNHNDSGLRLKLSHVLRNETSPIVRHKTANYLDNFMEMRRAQKEGIDDYIFLNTKGFVTETTKCNIFFAKDDIIYTPSIDCGLLSGITREWALNKLKSIYRIHEGQYNTQFLMNCNEVFLTNSVVGIKRVSQINKKYFDKHEISQFLYNEYLKDSTNNEDG